MDDAQVLEAFHVYRATGDRRVRNQLVEAHRWVALTCARRFRGRGELIDDLVQVGMLGLVKAVERFDPSAGTPFAGFAMPTVAGELRRHFRDATWAVHVPRRMKELAALVPPATERLRSILGRHPSLDELAQELRVSVDDVIGAMEASSAYRSTSIHVDRSDGDGVLHEAAEDDARLDQADASVSVSTLLASLPEREKTILYLRFFEERSQSEIAQVVGTSQVHVSRLIRSSLASLRRRAGGPSPEGADVRGDESA